MRITRIYSRLALFALALYSCLAVEARLTDRYNKNRPLLISCDWDLPPYEFRDNKGEPAGFNIELVTLIAKRLGLPWQLVMKESTLALETFQNHEADLLISPLVVLDKSGVSCYVSSSVLSSYKVMVAERADMPVVSKLSDIDTTKTVVMRRNGNRSLSLLWQKKAKITAQLHAPMEALLGVSRGRYDYFIWGEHPLKWKIKELNLDNLRIYDIGIPPAEAHFASYDQELIDAFDDQFARLEHEGVVGQIHEKWFHPERQHDNASPFALYIVVALVLLFLVLLLVHRLAYRRVKSATQWQTEQSQLMDMAFNMSGYMVTEYNPKTHIVMNRRGNLVRQKGTTLEQLMGAVHPDYVKQTRNQLDRLMADKNLNSVDLTTCIKTGDGAQSQWQYLDGHCARMNNSFFFVFKDVTQKLEEQKANDLLATKYFKAFETTVAAMSFYDSDGKLLDMNEEMKQLLATNEKSIPFFLKTNLFEAPLFKGVLQRGMRDVVHICQRAYYPDISLDKYVECRIRPVIEDDKIIYYVVTIRDVTDERNLYREQQATEKQLKSASDEINRSENQLAYLLSKSNMFIFRCDYKDRIIKFSRSLKKVDYTVTIEQYVEGMVPEEREQAKAVFGNLNLLAQPVNVVHHFTNMPMLKGDAWYAISGTPLFDKNNVLEAHFGVVRNITELMLSQEDLRRETARAKESGKLKAAFLANMTHEIRTPLNAIVGFSDLLQMVEAPEERKEYIRIIQNNCDMLMRLIDDILEVSKMNEKPQSIDYEYIDFAAAFNDICTIVEQRVQDPNVTFIKDAPYKTFPAYTDKQRVQQVITNFVTNAVKYTQKGFIKVGYRAENDGIYIYCTDTGAGIPKDKQTAVFERFVKLNDFVQGTGLGLSICKAIADRFGGKIGVISEGEGKGSTFWFWIPQYQ